MLGFLVFLFIASLILGSIFKISIGILKLTLSIIGFLIVLVLLPIGLALIIPLLIIGLGIGFLKLVF